MNIHLMNVVVDLIEQRLTPIANIITRNQHITAMRDGFSLAMPFVIVGSLMVPLLFPPVAISSSSFFGQLYLQLRPMLLPTFELTLGLVALIVAFGASASLAKQYQLPEAIMSLVKPLVAASDTLPAVLLSVLVCQVLWFAGIHGALIVTGIMNPFWMANLSVNQAAMAAGSAIPHIYVQGFWDHYLLIGGVGSTLPLAFLLLRSKAIHLRTIGRMGVVPGLFNINEPILFGAPIIMNPLFFLPFVLVPMVNATLAWFALDLDLVSRVVSMTPWTTPAPIGASWAANWSFSPVILCLMCMVTSAAMYLPFLKAYEKQLLEQENENAVEHAQDAAQSA